ncbi:Predicted oxidoreductase [Salinibacillus kushneri]|uniref:Predicted oxidoreductase n=2 Tax=Salinibacillus kushneri TaxID=237682 RepID=A0A1I0JI27_9BACI|nr:Predicted oxidoreductase [Salinibacillus kushneri]
MKQVQIGQTGLYVNPIGMGTNAVGGHNLYPKTDDEEGRELVKSSIDAGVNFLDTAYLYGPGRSEELIGEALKDMSNREDIVLATKGGVRFAGEDMEVNNTPSFLKQNVEESLKRLQTDYIDLFYIHYPNQDTPKFEAVGALKELKDEGKIRAIGVSNFSIEDLKEANQDGYVDVYQGEYNLINRTAEKELLPFTEKHKISFVPYFPFASGLLAGKYTKETTFQDFRADMPHLQGDAFKRNLKKVEELRQMANTKNKEVSQLVLAWYLSLPSIDTVIPGAKRLEQVKNNLKAHEVELTKEEVEKINQIFS